MLPEAEQSLHNTNNTEYLLSCAMFSSQIYWNLFQFFSLEDPKSSRHGFQPPAFVLLFEVLRVTNAVV